MNQIQLSRNIDIRMFLENKKYNSLGKKLKHVGLLFLLIILGFFFFYISTNKTPNNNFNNDTSTITSDTTKKTTPQNNDTNPLVVYGDLLKKIESKTEEKNMLTISIESSKVAIEALMSKTTVKETIKDTISKHKLDSVSIKNDIIKKTEAQKIKQIKIKIDSIESKKIEYSKKIKQIDDDIAILKKQLLIVKPSLQKNAAISIENSLSQQNGQGEFDFKGMRYYMCVVNMESKTQEINFHLKNKVGKNYSSILSLLKDKELDSLDFLMVTNGGMYTPNHEPQGLFIEKGKTIKPLDESTTNNNTNFYLFPNGVFYIDSNNNANIKNTTEYSKLCKTLPIKYATQSGPMLVVENKIHDKFVQGSKNINIRSGVGIVDNKNVIFLISNGYVNFWDFATVFKDVFGCKNALYLDGAISLMYLNIVNKNDVGGNFGPLISVTKRKN